MLQLKNKKSANRWYLALKWILRTLFSVPIYIDYKRNDPPLETVKIFAANHPSTLDPIMLIIVLKEQVSALIASSIFNIPLIGGLLKKAGQIPVLENQGRLAYQTALKKLRQGQDILIYPEGSLSYDDGTTKETFSGAVRLAMESKLPIIPIGISFSKDRWLRKKLVIKGKEEHARFYLFGYYAITFGKPIFVTENIKDKSIIEKSKKILINKIDELAEESALRIYSR